VVNPQIGEIMNKINDWKDTFLKTAGQIALDAVRLGTATVIADTLSKKAKKLFNLDEEEKPKKHKPSVNVTDLLDTE
jgi:hypothetical protein